jgi:hypothetical protein
VTTRGELEEVEVVDGAGLNTGDVAESEDEVLAILLGVVDDKRTTALLVAATPHLTLTSADLARVLSLLDVGTGTDSLEKGNGSGGLLDGAIGEGGRGDNEGNLRDGGDGVTAGKEKSRAARGGERGGGREALLVEVDLLVPLAPDLGGYRISALLKKAIPRGTYGQTCVQNGTCYRKRPDQRGEFRHQRHEGYGQQRDQFPRTQHWSGDQPSR